MFSFRYIDYIDIDHFRCRCFGTSMFSFRCPITSFLRLLSFLKHEKTAGSEETLIERRGHRRSRGLYFTDLEKNYFSDCLKKLKYRWTECFKLKGEYIEK